MKIIMEEEFVVEFGIIDKADLSPETLKKIEESEKIPLEEYINY